VTSPDGATPIREAATVMLVRRAPLEVFMLRRNPSAVWVGGAHLFPGGALDPEDRDPRVAARCVGLDDATASRALGHRHGGLGYWVAAIREAFEEAGVLFARHADGRPLDPTDAVWARLTEHRDARNAGRVGFLEILEAEDLLLTPDALAVTSHWITPPGQARRYDTWFFAAAAPEGHTYEHDDGENTESTWVRPAEAIAAHDRGEIDLILPTRRSLELLDRFASARDALDAVAGGRRGPDGRAAVRREPGGGERVALAGEEVDA
jgi:8-oxo-dGTP pyrophosphatase MutT (NUDIX family)